jgi:CRISPR-associated protein Cas5d
MLWTIDAVRVMKPIQMESKGMRPIKMNGGNDLAYYSYLHDVEYQVLAHFEWNEFRPELARDRNEHKHHNIALRSVEQGGRRDVFLGTRECQAYVEPCTFCEGTGAYDEIPCIDFGVMFHGFDYPDETGRNELAVRLWRQSMEHGITQFPPPSETSLRRVVREYGKTYTFKRFEEGRNLSIELG